MSYTEEDIEDLLAEQLRFLDGCNKQIMANAVAYHQRVCDEPSEDCEEQFLYAFLELLGRKIKERGRQRGIHFVAHRVNLN